METNVLTTMLTDVVTTFNNGYVLLEPSIRWLLATFGAIEIVWIGLLLAESGDSAALMKAVRKVFFLCFFGWIVVNWMSITDDLVQGFRWAGEKAGGGTMACTINDPSCIMNYAFQATEPISEFAEEHEPGMLDSVVLGVTKVGIIIAYLVGALQMCMVIAEFAILRIVAGFLMPFGVMEKTHDIAQKGIAAMLGVGIKVMVLTLILYAIDPVVNLTSSHPAMTGGEISYNQIFTLLAVSWFMALLMWIAPGMASTMLGGSPTLSATQAIRGGATAVSGGVMAVRTAINTPGGIRNAGSKLQTAYGGLKRGAWNVAAIGHLARRR